MRAILRADRKSATALPGPGGAAIAPAPGRRALGSDVRRFLPFEILLIERKTVVDDGRDVAVRPRWRAPTSVLTTSTRTLGHNLETAHVDIRHVVLFVVVIIVLVIVIVLVVILLLPEIFIHLKHLILVLLKL